MWAQCLYRKPLEHVLDSDLNRVFDLYSLVSIGIGGTVGSGIFVLSGTIATCCAGPFTFISWIIAGVACFLTAFAYMELSNVVLSGGSTYSFCYAALGEIFAIVGASTLSLEYGVSGAAVARSWGDKLAFYISTFEILGCKKGSPCWLNDIENFNIGALIISSLVAWILLKNVEIGKKTLNLLVLVKVALVVFIIIAGFSYFETSVFDTSIFQYQMSNQYPSGILEGASFAFFGYIGFDEIACLSLEAKRPRRDIPLAVMITVVVITILYVTASIALVGMVGLNNINSEEGFGSAFKTVGAKWILHVIMIGQIVVVLPAVVLVSYMPQSRLFYIMSKDSILPKLFSRVEDGGSLYYGNMLNGIAMTAVATVVPFRYLGDLINAGILVGFIATNICLLILRHRTLINRGRGSYAEAGHDDGNAHIVSEHCDPGLSRIIVTFVIASGASAIITVNVHSSTIRIFVNVVVLVIVFAMWFVYFRTLPSARDSQGFKAPGVPLVPCLAIHINWLLFAKLSIWGIFMFIAYIGICLGLYATTMNATPHHAARVQGACSDASVDEGVEMLSRTNSVENLDHRGHIR